MYDKLDFKIRNIGYHFQWFNSTGFHILMLFLFSLFFGLGLWLNVSDGFFIKLGWLVLSLIGLIIIWFINFGANMFLIDDIDFGADYVFIHFLIYIFLFLASFDLYNYLIEGLFWNVLLIKITLCHYISNFCLPFAQLFLFWILSLMKTIIKR